MSIRLVVFVTPNEPSSVKRSTLLINRLHKLHLTPFVDAIHRNHPAWLESAYKDADHRCFTFAVTPPAIGVVTQFFYPPDLIVWYEQPIRPNDWILLERTFGHLIDGERTILTRHLSNLLRAGDVLTPRPPPPFQDTTNVLLLQDE